MIDVLKEAVQLGTRHHPAALLTVTRVAGSTPRSAGAKMIVCADGQTIGTVGGGQLEHEVVAVARAVASGASATRVHRHLVRDLAMCCGGEMELWIEPIDAGRTEALLSALRCRDARKPVALITSMTSSGKSLASNDPCLATRRLRLADGFYVEPILPQERLVIFGAGHIAYAMAPLAASVGFDVVVCDEDETYCNADRFPKAKLRATFYVAEVEDSLGGLGPDDYVLIVTRAHAVDQALLEKLLPRTGLAYLGMVGSAGKRGRFRRRLEAKQISSNAAWDRLHSPAGVDIAAETPEEIALSIVAELVKTRTGK